jgi:hypothetical protein
LEGVPYTAYENNQNVKIKREEREKREGERTHVEHVKRGLGDKRVYNLSCENWANSK